jgi:hypothetical protein
MFFMPPSTPTELPPPVNHVFVDCENVHHVDPEVIGQKAVNFTFLYGPKIAKFDVAVVQKLIEHAASVQLVRLTLSGRNALDLTLAYYLGRCVLADPTAYFHIVSKDKDFDPLIEHLRSQHINARRHDDFTTLTFSAPKKVATQPESKDGSLESRVVENLRKTTKNRPKNKQKLLTHIRHLAGETASEKEISGVFDKLCRDGQVKVGDKDAVNYDLKKSSS